ncbi:5'-methylthioadenosine/S-adenosylhomocysteine nucleosidase [Xanthobacter sp. VTT E-85241]|uniref:5'-methylthioadenosine/S-adenosylhomocysteine nucleosidase n=1 Tax=Roseixanthobacter finlandensis TaxID=3119922 RepID=UPI00372B0323
MEDPSRHVRTVGDLDILFVMATQMEYGPHLRARIDPLITGVGPVEAAMTTTHALAHLAAADALPDLVFTLGSAGARALEHAGIYQVSHLAYRDMDASPLGFEKGRTPFLDLPALVEIPHQIPGIAAASLSTGGAIISGAAYDAISCDMVDMETFAVLRAAQRFAVPLVGLRGISDGRTELSRYEDWTEYLHVIDERLAAALDHFEAQVKAGAFPLAPLLAPRT